MTPKQENKLTLARLLGISEEQASERLAKRVAIAGAGAARELALELSDQIGRTLTLADDCQADVEVVLEGDSANIAPAQIFVQLAPNQLEVSDVGPAATEAAHAFLVAIAGCYVASVVVDCATGLNRGPKPLVVPFEALGATQGILAQNITLADPVLVGAGAIGNGFLRALRHLNVAGSMIVADPKEVAEGNTNRCLYFDESSIGKPKAQELCERAQPDFPNLRLIPFNGSFSELRKRDGKIRRVIVAADSRRVRRSIQSELPLEIIDASTTGTEEIIIHSHREPTIGACLACIYRHVPDELSREREIASGLGISIEDVQRELIDEEIAQKIIKSHSELRVEDILGKAFDSLFRELCAAQALLLPSGEQVFAPFTFVSSLAGALLAIELLRFEAQGKRESTNYFFVSPWQPPNPMARRYKGKIAGCEFCGRSEASEAMKAVWGDELEV